MIAPPVRPGGGRSLKIGIIGAGDFGQAAATRLAAAGHELMLSNSRGPRSLEAIQRRLGPRVHAGTAAEAAAYGSLTLVAVTYGRVSSLPLEALGGRTVIDATNYYPRRDGPIRELDADRISSSELFVADLTDARCVKALNTIWYGHLLHEGRPRGDPGRLGIPIAGDDEEAKRIVAGLVDDMGFDAVDAGTLADGRGQQPGTSVFDRPQSAAEISQALGLAPAPEAAAAWR